MRHHIKTLLLAAAGMIIPVGLVSAVSVQPASAAGPTLLPISSYYQMAVDEAHGHIFISQGSSSQNGILVTDLTGQVVTTIAGQSGVTGITLSPDGSTLYAALSTADAVTAISTDTLAQTASYSLPAGDSPRDVAVQSGKVWVSYNTGTLFAAAIGFFDPSVASPTLQTPAAMSGWYVAPELAADPADTGVLVAIGPGQTVSGGLASYDTAANPVTTLAGSPGGPTVCSDEQDLAVAPGGSEFAVACHDVNAVDNVYSTATLSPLRSLGSPGYPAFPTAIAYDAAGYIAGGSTNNVPAPDLYIYSPGGTAALNAYALYTLTSGGILQPRGLAWLPDGSQVFGVLNRLPGFALAVVPNPTAPRQDPTSTVASCPYAVPAVTVGQATSCTVTVTDTAAGGTAPTGDVTFTSDTSGGSFSSSSCTLSPDSTLGQAVCSFSYTPGQTGSGTQTITATYGGDGSHAASSSQAVLRVTPRVTATVVTCQQAKPVLHECTATVSDTSPGSATAPAGTVSFSSSGSGVFSAMQCTLSAASDGMSSSCAVYYGAAPGVPMKGQTISASYGGDSVHQGSTGSATLP